MLWLVRHGESTANVGASTNDPGESPLTQRGRSQALTLAQQLASVDRVICSHYVRAEQTAHIVAYDAGKGNKEVWPDIQEWNLLDATKYQGTNHTDRMDAVKAVVNRGDSDYADGPYAESFHDLLRRVHNFYERCQQLDPKETTVIVSHGWFIKALLWSFANRDYEPGQSPSGITSFWHFSQSFEIANCQRFSLTLASPD